MAFGLFISLRVIKKSFVSVSTKTFSTFCLSRILFITYLRMSDKLKLPLFLFFAASERLRTMLSACSAPFLTALSILLLLIVLGTLYSSSLLSVLLKLSAFDFFELFVHRKDTNLKAIHNKGCLRVFDFAKSLFDSVSQSFKTVSNTCTDGENKANDASEAEYDSYDF